jgi:mannose-6-phosphate isomerase-like protein (cupin superfamily)
MSYPPQSYTGEGEISAMLRKADGPPDLAMGTGSQLRYLLTGADTGRQLGLYHCEFLGPPSGADPHYHTSLEEWFYVLHGTVDFYDGRDWVPTTQGGLLYASKRSIHGFRNLSGAPASMLLGFVPGQAEDRPPREKFFAGFAELAAGRWHPGPDEFRAFMAEHDNHMVLAG